MTLCFTDTELRVLQFILHNYDTYSQPIPAHLIDYQEMISSVQDELSREINEVAFEMGLEEEFGERHAPLPESGSRLFRVVAPKTGGDPTFQYWLNDGEDGEPNLRPDYRVLTNWTAY